MILKISLVFFACLNTLVFSLPHNPGIHPRIINGADAEPGQFPHMAQIKAFYGWGYLQRCAGAIVSSHWVLTAGLCCDGLSLSLNIPTVIVGTNILSEGGATYNVGKIVMHPEFNHTSLVSLENDLCLVRLSKDLKESDLVQNITLASPEDDLIQDVIVSGWGIINKTTDERPENLQFLETTLVSNEECDEAWKSQTEVIYYPVTETKVCSSTEGQKGICGGDRGAPLVVKDKNGVMKLVGIASYDLCAKEVPDVYTRVSKYVDWINSVIRR